MSKLRSVHLATSAALLAAGVTSFLIFSMLASWEDGLMDQIVSASTEQVLGEEARALALMQTTHELLGPRLALLKEREYLGVHDELLRSATGHLIDGKGACGSHTHVLARLLQRAGFDVRVAAMKVDGVYGGHIICEARVSGRWVPLDALFDLVFRRADGQLATFEEVGADWARYRTQAPSGYPDKYNYEGVRYTNWSRVPPWLRSIQGVIARAEGVAPETVSLRTYVLNKYRLAAYISLVSSLVSALLLWLGVASWRRFMSWRRQRLESSS